MVFQKRSQSSCGAQTDEYSSFSAPFELLSSTFQCVPHLSLKSPRRCSFPHRLGPNIQSWSGLGVGAGCYAEGCGGLERFGEVCGGCGGRSSRRVWGSRTLEITGGGCGISWRVGGVPARRAWAESTRTSLAPYTALARTCHLVFRFRSFERLLESQIQCHQSAYKAVQPPVER